MNNYKINKNKPSIGTEQVLKHKDFNKVLHEYKGLYNYKNATKPFYKNVKFLGFIVLVCTVALVVMVVDREESEEPKEEKKKEEVIKQVPATVTPVIADTTTKVTTEEAAIVSKKKEPKKSVVKKNSHTIIKEDSSSLEIPNKPQTSMPVQETKGKPKTKAEVKNNKDLIYQKNM